MAFNTRISYEGSARGQGFSPVQIPDITPLLRENMDVELKNIQRRGDQELAAQTATAEMLSSKMRTDEKTKLTDLAKFSQTLQESMIGFANQQKKAAEDEAINLFYLDSENFSQEEMDKFNEEEKQLSQIDDQLNNVAAKGIQKGAPYSAADRLKSLSGWKAYFYAQEMAKEAVAGRQGWINQRMATDNETQITIAGRGTFTPAQAVTPAEKAAARAQLNAQYERATGLDGINNRFKNARVYPQFREQDRKQDEQWANQYNADLSAQERDRLVTNFASDRNITKLLQGANATVDFKQVQWGFQRSWELADQALKSLIDQDKITEADELHKIFDMPIPGRKGKTYLSEYGHRLQPLLDHLKAHKVKVYNELQFTKRVEEEQQEETYRTTLQIDQVPEAQLIRMQKAHRARFGKDSKFLSLLMDGNSLDDFQENNINDEVERRALANVLTPEYVQSLPTIKLQQRWMPIAVQQYKDNFDTNKFETSKKAFKGLVNTYIAPTPDGTSSFEGAFIYQGLMQQFIKEYNIIKAAPGISAAQAEMQAANTVRETFKLAVKDPSSPYFKGPKADDPFPNLFKTSTGAKQSIAAHKAHIANVYKNMSNSATRADFLKKPNAILSKEQLKAAANGFGSSSWKVHPLIHMVADTYRMNPLDLMNQLLDNNQLPKLQVPERTGLDGLTPQQRNLLSGPYGSTNRGARGANSVGTYTNRYFTKEISDIVVKAAKAAGHDPSLMAGLAMTESSGNPFAVNPDSGTEGLYQIHPRWHPNVTREQRRDPKFSAKYANQLLKDYTKEAGGDFLLALARYGGYGEYSNPVEAAMQEYIPKVIHLAMQFGYNGPLINLLTKKYSR